MSNINAAGNVEIPAYLTLLNKGSPSLTYFLETIVDSLFDEVMLFVKLKSFGIQYGSVSIKSIPPQISPRHRWD